MLNVTAVRPTGFALEGGAERSELAAYQKVPASVRWSFMAFAAVLPFEAANLAITSSTFSIAKLAALFFFASYFFYHNPLSGYRPFPPVSAALRWFLLYLLVFAAHGLFLEPFYRSQFVTIFLTLAQLLALFWVSSSLLRLTSLARRVLLAFAGGAVVCALGTLAGVPGFATAIETHAGERVTALDFNPNYLAYTMALAAVILIGTALDLKSDRFWTKPALIAAALPLLAILVRTGSRTGVAIFAIGFATCFLPGRRDRSRLGLLLASLFFTGALGYMIVQDRMMWTRVQESYAGNLAGRERIIPTSLEMISERPVLGWQPVVFWEELGRRVGLIWRNKDAHNLLFHLLLEVGIVGTVPFVIATWLCLLGAWRARAGKFGSLPFALLIMTLTANLTHTYLTRKPQWLILGLAAAFSVAATTRKTETARYVIRRPLVSAGARPPLQ